MGASNPTYSTVVGSADIVALPDKRAWNLTDGVHTVKRWAGTSDAIAAKFNELSAAADSGVDDLDEDINGKAGRLIARIIEDSGSGSGGNTEELNAVWELYASEILKPIEGHSDFDGVTTPRKREIEEYARTPAKTAGIPVTNAEKALFGYYANQTLDFILTELDLRKTTTLSSRSAITASYTSMNRVVTLASIAPPTALLGALTSLPLMSGASGAWEWLKLCPQTRQVAKRKFQLSYAWRGAERWAEIYGGSWTPSYP
jgi:hypothetical protein